MPRNRITRKRKRKAELKPDITTKRRLTRMQRNRAYKPHLAHSRHHTRNTAAECEDGGEPWWKLARLVVELGNVGGHAAFVDEMVGKGDSFVDGEPVTYVIE